MALISVNYKLSFALSTSSLVVPCGAASDSTMLISIFQIRKLRLNVSKDTELVSGGSRVQILQF